MTAICSYNLLKFILITENDFIDHTKKDNPIVPYYQNDAYLLLDDSDSNIEYKYQTVISLYYFKLLEIQVRKIENDFGADEEYNKNSDIILLIAINKLIKLITSARNDWNLIKVLL